MKVKLLHPDAKLPTKAHDTDAGFDLYSLEDRLIEPHTTVKISTGIAFGFDPGTYGLIRDRSSCGSKGILVAGGVLDNLYTGHCIVCLTNSNTYDYMIEKGNRIAQLLILPLIETKIEVVNELSTTNRGEKGFGSSGV